MRTFISLLLLSSASITSAYAATTTALPSIVEMQTNVGTVTIELNHDKAPISSKNFLNYVNSNFYKNTMFHRIYSGYDTVDGSKLLLRVVQGGGFDAPTKKKKATNPPIVNEANNGLHNSVGTIAMARSAEPNSATAQFFFNVTDNSEFFDLATGNAGYAVFGKVISGMDLVTKIGNYNTIKTTDSYDGSPKDPVLVPYVDGVSDCGFNFCVKKVIVEAVYTSDILDTLRSATRITVNGNGKVTSLPSGLLCGIVSKTCSLKKPFGTALQLITKPSAGYEFKGWTGDCQVPNNAQSRTQSSPCIFLHTHSLQAR